jgi:TIR domain
MKAGPRVFISYRREDCMPHALLLAEKLQSHANAEVFLDIESVAPGVSFPELIEREIASCDVALVLIGDDWLQITDSDGAQRIRDPQDWVHIEIRSALERGVLTIPVLVEGAAMPRPQDLPEPISHLAFRHAVDLRDATFGSDFERLARALPGPAAKVPPPPASAEAPNWPARFTDSWFETNVPPMDEEQLRQLRAELYQRRWSDDEIAERALTHVSSSRAPLSIAPDQPPHEPGPKRLRFPSRFTDAWFAEHVPAMDAVELEQLRDELRGRGWSDEEVDQRALAHPAGDPPAQQPRPARPSSIPTAHVKTEDPVARAATLAASDIEALALSGHKLRERDLADAIVRHLDHAVAERRLHIPGWLPQPGNVDVFTVDRRGRPRVVIETKLKSDDRVFECLWDMAKMLSLATEETIEGAYLVAGTTVANWHRPVACAELFAPGRHELVGAIERYADWWEKYILGDSTGRPQSVPDLMDVELVASVRFDIAGVAWELRAIRVAATADGHWIPFDDGKPARWRAS